MVCQICYKDGHDKQYCPIVFCKEIVNEIFDISINENITPSTLCSYDILNTIMMSQHKRLGEKSLLRHLNEDIIWKILSRNDKFYICDCKTITDRTTVSSIVRYLKNSKDVLLPIVIYNSNVYTVVKNNTIQSLKNTYGIPLYNSILDFQFINDDYILVTTTKDNTTCHISYIHFNSNQLIWVYNIDDTIFNPMIFNNIIIAVTTSGKIIRIDTVSVKIINVHILQKNILDIYYNKNCIYMSCDDNDVAKYHVETSLIQTCAPKNDKSVRVIYTSNDMLSYLYNNRTIIFSNSNQILSKIRTHYDIYFDPIIIEKDNYNHHVIAVISNRKKISYFLSTDKKKWTVTLRSNVSCYLYIDLHNQYLYVGTIDKYMHKICVSSGEILWRNKIKGIPIGEMKYNNGMIYVQTKKPSNLIEIVT